MERDVLSLLIFNRSYYDILSKHLDMDDFSDIGQTIINQLNIYYETDPSAQDASIDSLKRRVEMHHPSTAAGINTLLDELRPVSSDNVLSDYVDMRLQSLSRRIAQDITNPRRAGEARELIERYRELREAREAALGDGDKQESSVTMGIDLGNVLSSRDAESLIPIFPDSLNDALGGGVPAGTHIVVFARPETGKSMFCINQIGGCIEAGIPTLYVGNEDPRSTIQERIISNVFGYTREEIHDGAVTPEDLEYLSDHFVHADLHPGSIQEIRDLMIKYRPRVVMVDQMRNLNTPKSFTKVESLEYVAKALRNLGKEFGAVMISITQAGDSADNKVELGMGDVDFSNTGIPATADLMLGIGVNPMLEGNNLRKISRPKNKINGDHSSIDVRVDPQLSRVYST